MLRGLRWTTVAALLLAAATPEVCLGQILPPAPEAAAKVIQITGAVSVLKDDRPWALSLGDSVQVRQVITSGPDGHAVFQVSDGSTFEVFPNSWVTFRKNPPNWRDLVDVMVGRIKVHIQKIGNQPNPNRIYTPTAVISVRGTTFDIDVSGEDESTQISVEEGQVAVQHLLLPRGDAKLVNAGETLVVYKTQPLEAHTLDRGTMVQWVLRAMVDAAQTIVMRTTRVSTGIPSSGGISTDTKRTPPPTGPPPTP